MVSLILGGLSLLLLCFVSVNAERRFWSSAIAVYFDAKVLRLLELRGLFASWFASTIRDAGPRESIDLVVFAHQAGLQMLQQDPLLSKHCKLFVPNVTVHDASVTCLFVQSMFSIDTDYQFLNSVKHVTDAAADMLDAYDFVLRTDCDTFVTPAFARWRPTQFHCGLGAYAQLPFTRQKLADWSAKLGVRHRGLHNLGASWYGPTAEVRRASVLAARLTRQLYDEAFEDRTTTKGWPKWHYGVALLYGQELAINALVDVRPTELMDMPAHTSHSINSVVLVHSFHTSEMFSKFAFATHRYKHVHDSIALRWPTTQCRVWAVEMAWRGNAVKNRTIYGYIRTFPNESAWPDARWVIPALMHPPGRKGALCGTGGRCFGDGIECKLPYRVCVNATRSARTLPDAMPFRRRPKTVL
jgi:hypothetical protein